MEYILLFIEALIDLSNEMAIFIIFGLLFAGIMHELIPETLVTKHLGKENIWSVIKSTVFGIPLPVCSCGVIPLATSIKKSGASKGATLSFLISTPITGVDSIMATYGIFGWIFTIYRAITSMIIAMVAGILTNIFDKEEPVKAKFTTVAPSKETLVADACCSTETSCCGTDTSKKEPFIVRVLSYAFGTLLKDIAKPLFWGLLLGALITVAIPSNLSEILVEYAWLSYIIVILIAVPMYVCATASLPIAAGLMLSGVSAGAAFVFLSAGPATNTVTIGVVKKMLGTRSLYIYLGSIVIGSILFGLGLDYLFSASEIDPKTLVQMGEHTGVFALLSSVVLWIFMMYYLFEPYFKKEEEGSCCG
ncbi:MAG: Transporter [uncultured Sulfurovum sp.]|uniref:Transporter n=1 Tax=uncultured Sulfurovum sp. TaxID=269237 RepID=A0A6S6UBN7_9BACT|nr:MAG: Transporter [uncultured Sulfurovum sp.]